MPSGTSRSVGQTHIENTETGQGLWPAPGTGENVARGLYARVSTHDQQTLSLQTRAMREYAAKRGWGIALQSRFLPASNTKSSGNVSARALPKPVCRVSISVGRSRWEGKPHRSGSFIAPVSAKPRSPAASISVALPCAVSLPPISRKNGPSRNVYARLPKRHRPSRLNATPLTQ